MSYELRIRIYGSNINLLIGRILKDQKEAVLEYCKNHEKKLRSVWYFPTDDDQKFMADLFQTEEVWVYSKIPNVFEINGIVFQDKIQIPDFLQNKLNRPTIQEIYLKNIITDYDGSKIKYHYRESIGLPQIKEDHIFVYYGFIDRLAVTYKFTTESPFFNEKNLEFHFTDCEEYGIVLSNAFYDGSVAKRVSRGSTEVHMLEVKFI